MLHDETANLFSPRCHKLTAVAYRQKRTQTLSDWSKCTCAFKASPGENASKPPICAFYDPSSRFRNRRNLGSPVRVTLSRIPGGALDG
jgi:hypothetical protein